MKTRPRTLLLAVVIAVIPACESAHTLELDVANYSAAPATVEVVQGSGETTPTDAFVHLMEVLDPGEKRTLDLERPGPGGWTLMVNGEAATDSDDWPADSPTIELAVLVHPDGSIGLAGD